MIPHSKTPWKPVKTALNAITVKAKGGSTVCEIINDKGSTLTPLMEDNAAFIAHAVNCHEELLIALRRLVDRAESATHYLEVVDDEDDQDAINKFVVSIRLAKESVAKAEGRT